MTFAASAAWTNGRKVLESICFCFFSEWHLPVSLWSWGRGGRFALSAGFCLPLSVTKRLMYYTLDPDESCLPSVQQTPGRCRVPKCQVGEREMGVVISSLT